MLRSEAEREPEEPRSNGTARVVISQVALDLDEQVVREVLEIGGPHTQAAKAVPDVGGMDFEELA